MICYLESALACGEVITRLRRQRNRTPKSRPEQTFIGFEADISLLVASFPRFPLELYPLSSQTFATRTSAIIDSATVPSVPTYAASMHDTMVQMTPICRPRLSFCTSNGLTAAWIQRAPPRTNTSSDICHRQRKIYAFASVLRMHHLPPKKMVDTAVRSQNSLVHVVKSHPRCLISFLMPFTTAKAVCSNSWYKW